MPPRYRPLRGLASLRTLGGRADQRVPSYKAYLRVSFLELERARHGQEIRTARRRLEFMTERCRQIDAEKREILAAAGIAATASRPPEAAGGRLPSAPSRRGFRFTY